VLGTLLYLLGQQISPSPEPRPEPVVIRIEQLDRIRQDWMRSTGHAPTKVEIDRSVAELVDDELLFREALALGLQHDDAVVTRRMIANQRFVEPRESVAAERRGDAALLRDAHGLGMARTDLVVRRRLIERMRERILGAARVDDPERPARGTPDAPWDGAARVRLDHVFLSRDARGEQLANDAAALRERLANDGLTPDEAIRLGLGDPLLVQARQPWSTLPELEARLGRDFAVLAFQLPPNRWSEPIPSTYGLHLVWVDERVDATPRSTDETARWRRGQERAARERVAVQSALSLLRRDVEVIREERPPIAAPGGP
jgi:hypothetical protein